ncbi:MAG: hypothetical protein IJQ80_06065, partial [Clostridia bacterium]|nr:hypothetical protein [Clostridia bacterium]
MPAVVIGPVVALIGLSLAGNAVGDLQTSNYTRTENALDEVNVVVVDSSSTPKYVALDGTEIVPAAAEEASDAEEADPVFAAIDKETNQIRDDVDVTYNKEENTIRATVTTAPGSIFVAIICGLITLATIIIASTFGKKTAKLIPFIIGILAGYLAAFIFFLIGRATGNDALKVINFSSVHALFADGVTFSTFIHVPKFTFLTAAKGFSDLGNNLAYIGTIAVAYIPVAFVVFAEHIADHKNISSIIEKDLLEDPGLHRTLLGDGVGSMAGAFFGGCPNTTYGESIGCVAITKNASIATIFCAAVEVIIV